MVKSTQIDQKQQMEVQKDCVIRLGHQRIRIPDDDTVARNKNKMGKFLMREVKLIVSTYASNRCVEREGEVGVASTKRSGRKQRLYTG